jgi:hypothetical protein
MQLDVTLTASPLGRVDRWRVLAYARAAKKPGGGHPVQQRRHARQRGDAW